LFIEWGEKEDSKSTEGQVSQAFRKKFGEFFYSGFLWQSFADLKAEHGEKGRSEKPEGGGFRCG
jgi:hypothetical protein